MSSRARPRRSQVFTRVFLACFIVCIGLLANWSPAPVGAASIVVDTALDAFDVGGDAGCGNVTIAGLPGGGDAKISLREAICAANNTAGDDVITFNLPNPSTIVHNGSMGRYVINSNIQITGPGASILDLDGNDEVGIFRIDSNSGTVGISGLAIGHAADFDNGAAILNRGTLTLTDVTINNNRTFTAHTFGGGIYNSGTLTLVRTIVRDNQANYGGGIYNSGILTVSDSEIHANLAQNGAGGGVYNEAQATFTNTSFTRNEATATVLGGGGGIASGIVFIDLRVASPAELTPSLSLTGVTMSDNSAPIGGALLTQQSGATITSSTIEGNFACVGGGIYAFLGTLAISNTTINENGASIPREENLGVQQIVCPESYNDGGGLWANGTLTVTNSTFSDNRAEDHGGAIYLEGAVGGGEPAQISYSTITGNRADTDDDENIDGGGGIYYYYVGGSLIEAAAANGVQVNSSIVAGNLGPKDEEDCDGTITSTGHNIFGGDTGCAATGTGDLTTGSIAAVLDTTLAANGGPTKTHALVANSPALNAGDPATCPATDQRGIGRPSGGGCDSGAYELVSDIILTVQTTGTGTVIASPTPTSTGGTPTNATYTYSSGTVVTLTATPGQGQVFARWIIDGAGALPYGKGWASPLTITLDAAHTAQAQFETRPTFSDVPTSNAAYLPITELAARGIARGYTAAGCAAQQPPVAIPCYGPGNRTVRAETAIFLTRLLGLEAENHGNGGFTDLAGQSAAAQQAIGTMAHYGIFQGYTDGRFGPNDPITHTELTLVISRSMVFKGYWTRATQDDPAIYPNLDLGAQPRLDLVTFVQHAGNLPGFANNTPRAAVDQPALRDWTAQALWLALNSHFGVDQPGKGGFVP